MVAMVLANGLAVPCQYIVHPLVDVRLAVGWVNPHYYPSSVATNIRRTPSRYSSRCGQAQRFEASVVGWAR